MVKSYLNHLASHILPTQSFEKGEQVECGENILNNFVLELFTSMIALMSRPFIGRQLTGL